MLMTPVNLPNPKGSGVPKMWLFKSMAQTRSRFSADASLPLTGIRAKAWGTLKTGMIGTLFEDQVSKIYTTPARESDVELKPLKYVKV